MQITFVLFECHRSIDKSIDFYLFYFIGFCPEKVYDNKEFSRGNLKSCSGSRISTRQVEPCRVFEKNLWGWQVIFGKVVDFQMITLATLQVAFRDYAQILRAFSRTSLNSRFRFLYRYIVNTIFEILFYVTFLFIFFYFNLVSFVLKTEKNVQKNLAMLTGKHERMINCRRPKIALKMENKYQVIMLSWYRLVK